jgi:uncharacterized protein YgbK (DUF1537 family)
MGKSRFLLGCVADDFTGGSDAASFLSKQGLVTMLCNGIPTRIAAMEDCNAVVIALKTRSVEPEAALRESLAAFDLLDRIGAEKLYFKYCSTFDSTPRGNIGPVADAVLEKYKIPYTVLCPSLPVNKRTVTNGRLYVDGVPLHETHMKNHPLNPMWSADIGELLRDQSKYPCMVMGAELLNSSDEKIAKAIDDFGRGKTHFYIVPDYKDDEQGKRIARIFGKLRFLTGGSGLLEFLPGGSGDAVKRFFPTGVRGRGIVLSGSCSDMTRRQIQYYKNAGFPCVAIDQDLLLEGKQSAETIWAEISPKNEEYLVYSKGAEEQTGVKSAAASRLIEETIAGVGRRARDAGFTRIICAGGESSGALTVALGWDSFYIGESAAPGVPVLIPAERPDVRLVLKSGNFGQEDFFVSSLKMIEDQGAAR